MGIEDNIQAILINLQRLEQTLPKKIREIQKTMNKEDAKKIQDAIKELNVEEKLKEFHNLPIQFEAFIKKHYGR